MGTRCLKKKREKKNDQQKGFFESQGYSRIILRNSAVCQIETRASGMAWGPRSTGCTPIFQAYQKVPPARKGPSDPSIFIPLGINRTQPCRRIWVHHKSLESHFRSVRSSFRPSIRPSLRICVFATGKILI